MTSAEGISMGLIMAELVINSLKHAFPGGKAGHIIVSFTPKLKGWELAVSDNGIGIVPDPTRKEGLGTTIVQSLARQLGASMHIETSPRGTTVRIERTPQNPIIPASLSVNQM